MKRAFLYFACLLLSLMFGSTMHAQCWYPNYSSYISRYVSGNTGPGTNNVYQTIIVTGTTTFTGSCQYAMGSVIHYARVTNKIDSSGGVYTGGDTPAGQYMDYTVSINNPNMTAGQYYLDNGDVELLCSAAGEFSSVFADIYVEVAYTRAISTGRQSNCYWNKNITQEVCDISAAVWCTPSSSPPDFVVGTVSSQVYPPPAPNWWEVFGLCVTYGYPGHLQPWVCPGGVGVEMYTPTPGQAVCTHNP